MRERKDWIDILRGMFMCMVYLYHCEVFFGSGHSWSWLFTPIFLTGFFFVSGFLFCKDWEQISIKKKCLQITRSIIFPYFIFMMAFLLPKIILLHYTPLQTIIDIVLFRASWFVIAIGVIQFVYAITLCKTKRVASFILFSLLYTLIGYSFVLLYRIKPIWMLNNWILHSSNMPSCWPACINLAFLSTPFFATGILYRKYCDKVKLPSSWFFGGGLLILYFISIIVDHFTTQSELCFAACSANNWMLIYIYFLIATVSLITLAQKAGRMTILSYIGANSITFYFMNIMMLRIAGAFYNRIIALCHLSKLTDSIGYVNNIFVTLIAIIATIPIVWFINKYIPVITGNKESFNKWTKKLKINLVW